jgi:hypothetical protein
MMTLVPSSVPFLTLSSLSLFLLLVTLISSRSSSAIFPSERQHRQILPLLSRRPKTAFVNQQILECLGRGGGGDDDNDDASKDNKQAVYDNEEEDDSGSGSEVQDESDEDEEWEEVVQTEDVMLEEEDDDEEEEVQEVVEISATTTTITAKEVRQQQQQQQQDDDEAQAEMEEEDGYDDNTSMFQEEVLVVDEEDDAVAVDDDDDDDDIRLVGISTTDGELADDEGFDSISAPEDATELAAVTAGGAVFEIEEMEEEEEEEVEEGDAVTDTTVEIAVISDEMKDVLRNELRYTDRDVLVMRPDIAPEVIANRLSRPIEGMPRNWYIEGTGPENTSRKGVIRVATGLAVGTAIGVTAYTVANNDESPIDGEAIMEHIKNIPKMITSVGKQLKDKAVANSSSSSDEEDRSSDDDDFSSSTSSEKTFTEEEMQEMENEVVHSIKPGTKALVHEEVEDKSALDKFLTKIENLIKAFFNMKI